MRAYPSDAARRRRLDSWLHTYNHHRCHTALDGQPPITRVDNLTGHYLGSGSRRHQFGVTVPPGQHPCEPLRTDDLDRSVSDGLTPREGPEVPVCERRRVGLDEDVRLAAGM